MNIVKQDVLNKKQFLKILWIDVWKGGFQLMQILGLLGMYFDAVVVEVEKYLLFSDWLWPYCGQKGGDKAKFNWKNTMAKFFYKIS